MNILCKLLWRLDLEPGVKTHLLQEWTQDVGWIGHHGVREWASPIRCPLPWPYSLALKLAAFNQKWKALSPTSSLCGWRNWGLEGWGPTPQSYQVNIAVVRLEPRSNDSQCSFYHTSLPRLTLSSSQWTKMRTTSQPCLALHQPSFHSTSYPGPEEQQAKDVGSPVDLERVKHSAVRVISIA